MGPFNRMVVALRRLEHIKQGKCPITQCLPDYFHISDPLAQSLNIPHPPSQKLPSGKPLRALVSQHEELGGCVGRVEEDAFGVVIVVSRGIATPAPDFIAIAPQ